MQPMMVSARLRPVLCTAVGLLLSGCGLYRPVTRAPFGLAHAAGGLYTVRPGDTLFSLGRTYGVSDRAIMRANGLTSTALNVGQQLRIPVHEPIRVPPGLVVTAPVRVPLYPSSRWTHIVVHHSATVTGSARMLDRVHRNRGFSNGLGYDFVIDNGTLGRRDGQIEVGPRWTRQAKGAHCDAGGMNDHGIGICLVGNFMTREPSEAQLASLEALVAKLQAYYRIPDSRVIRHKDVAGKSTACPGRYFPWSRLRSRLKQLAP